MKEETRNEIVSKLCEIISENKINNKELVEIISHLLFSIGSSLENFQPESSEEVLMRYAQDPTLGNVLMAQAYHMKETWTENERENYGQQSGIIQRQTEEE